MSSLMLQVGTVGSMQNVGCVSLLKATQAAQPWHIPSDRHFNFVYRKITNYAGHWNKMSNPVFIFTPEVVDPLRENLHF